MIEICPKDFFCWEGSGAPAPCGGSWGSQPNCDEGTTEAPVNMTGMLLMFLLLLIVIGTVLLRRLHKWYLQSSLRRKLGFDKFGSKLNDQLLNVVTTGKGDVGNFIDDGGQDQPFPVRDGMTFKYSNLTLTVQAAGKPKVVVNRVAGEVPAATMTAVMGPSGAGKTSFMNVLCDRAGYGVTTGELLLNGRVDRISNHRDVMGFVPQDDIVHDELTVRENLMYAALNRLPIDSGEGCRTKATCCASHRKKYVAYVDQVLALLQIGHVQHSVVGSVEKRGISGGQRKRVNIGLELVTDPDVLFLDEPTSGLDSTSSEIILAALKDISRRGRTIVMVRFYYRYASLPWCMSNLHLSLSLSLAGHSPAPLLDLCFHGQRHLPGSRWKDRLLRFSLGRHGLL